MKHAKCPKCHGLLRFIYYRKYNEAINIGFICTICGLYKVNDWDDSKKLTRWDGDIYVFLTKVSK